MSFTCSNCGDLCEDVETICISCADKFGFGPEPPPERMSPEVYEILARVYDIDGKIKQVINLYSESQPDYWRAIVADEKRGTPIRMDGTKIESNSETKVKG